VMALSSTDGTSFNIIKTILPQTAKIDSVADAQLWQQYVTGEPKANRTDHTLITVDGQSATRWLLDIPAQSAASGHDYIEQVYVVKDTSFYTITGLAITSDALTTYRPAIDGMIASIHFVP